jgi:O-methyltransferase involved in polyketide biosynthesis
VVVVAAGYDTRAYRLAMPGVRFFEVDLPSASARKQELVAEVLAQVGEAAVGLAAGCCRCKG